MAWQHTRAPARQLCRATSRAHVHGTLTMADSLGARSIAQGRIEMVVGRGDTQVAGQMSGHDGARFVHPEPPPSVLVVLRSVVTLTDGHHMTSGLSCRVDTACDLDGSVPTCFQEIRCRRVRSQQPHDAVGPHATRASRHNPTSRCHGTPHHEGRLSNCIPCSPHKRESRVRDGAGRTSGLPHQPDGGVCRRASKRAAVLQRCCGGHTGEIRCWKDRGVAGGQPPSGTTPLCV